MKTRCSVVFTLVLALLVVPYAYAADEGQSQPKLNKQILAFANLSRDLVPLTSGSGNVKGIICSSSSYAVLAGAQIHFYVDGSSARTLSLTDYPVLVGGDLSCNTGMIPMNVRFETSIRIGIQRSSTSDGLTCVASWGLD